MSTKHATGSTVSGKRRSANTGNHTKPSSARFPELAFRSFLITIAIGVVLIFIGSLVAYFLPDPDPMIRPIALTAVALTALTGGIAAGKIHRSAPAVCGTVNGLLLVSAMLLFSLFFRSFSSGYSAWLAALLHAAVPLLSFLGALIGVRKQRAR